MKNALKKTSETFESSSGRTPQYLEWFRLFKREFTKFLTTEGLINIEISKPNHFDMHGFFTDQRGQAWNFSVSDLRWSKENMLVRTATSYKDFTGGRNQSVSLASLEAFNREFQALKTS